MLTAIITSFAVNATVFEDTPERPFRYLRFEDVQLDGETSARVAK